MKSKAMLIAMAGMTAAGAGWCQIQAPAGRKQGPGVQASQDAREPGVLKACKTPPPTPVARGGRGRAGRGRGRGPVESGPKEVTVTQIPGVIAAGQQWKEIWEVDGNNADGIIAKDGGILIAQNDNSDVVLLDKNGKTSVAFTGTNTGGSVAVNSKGALLLINRGLNPSIEELAPHRHSLATKAANGDPLDCLGGVFNDLTADSKGGAYFTVTPSGVFYADSKGNVAKYGENIVPNGIVLSADEKHLFVTNGMTIAEFDVQKDGSLTNQREFAKLEGCSGGFCGGDGSTMDSAGRLYVSSQAGVQVIGPDGKYLGVIPTPRDIISLAFSGPDRKTLYAVSRDGAQNKDWIIGIRTIAQGPKGRGK